MECRLRQCRCCTPLSISRDACHVFPRPLTLPSCCRLQRNFRRGPAVCGRWVEACVIWGTLFHGLLHRVVDIEDDALRAVFTVGRLVLAFDDGEGLQNVVTVVAPDAVEVVVRRGGLTWP